MSSQNSHFTLFLSYSETPVSLKLVITIHERSKDSFTLQSQKIQRNCYYWDSLPLHFHIVDCVTELCKRIASYHMHEGNPYKVFTTLIPFWAGWRTICNKQWPIMNQNWVLLIKQKMQWPVWTIGAAWKTLKPRLVVERSHKTFSYTTFQNKDSSKNYLGTAANDIQKWFKRHVMKSNVE